LSSHRQRRRSLSTSLSASVYEAEFTRRQKENAEKKRFAFIRATGPQQPTPVGRIPDNASTNFTPGPSYAPPSLRGFYDFAEQFRFSFAASAADRSPSGSGGLPGFSCAVDVGKKIQENPLITRRKLALGSLRSLMNIDRLSVFGRSENDQRKKLVTVNERYARKRAILNAIFKSIFKFNDFVYPVKTAASSEMKREKRGKNARQRVKEHHLQRGHRNLSKHRNCDTRTVAFTNMRRARARACDDNVEK